MSNNWINKYLSPAETRFAFIITILFLILLIFQNINGRFWLNDFRVFYLAAKAFVHDDPVYLQQFGLSSGYFKYSPFSLLIFIPFSILPYFYAKLVYYLICTAFISLTIIASKNIWKELFGEKMQNSIYILIIAAIVGGGHLFREMHLGNINLLLLFALLFNLKLILTNKQKSAGLLFALILLIKPHFVVLIPLLLVRKKWLTLFSMTAGLGIGFIIPALFIGITKDISLHTDWINTILMHNATFLDSQNTIHIIFYNIFVKHISTDPGSLYVLILVALIALMILYFVLKNLKLERSSKEIQVARNNFSFEYLLIISLIPSLVLTDTEHFMFTLPLIAFILIYLFYSGNIKLIIISGVSFLLYFGNWGDVLGKYSYLPAQYGALGIGNLMIIGTSMYIFIRKIKTQSV